jgi:leukotriene-A4 hydrolase
MSIKNNYAAAYPRLEEFLTSIGRRKFVKPLFEELAKTPEGTNAPNRNIMQKRVRLSSD